MSPYGPPPKLEESKTAVGEDNLLFNNNEIFSNGECGVKVTVGADPGFTQNKIHSHGRCPGILDIGGKGAFTNNTITANRPCILLQNQVCSSIFFMHLFLVINKVVEINVVVKIVRD